MSSLRLPLEVGDVAWIRVFALERMHVWLVLSTPDPRGKMVRTHPVDIQRWKDRHVWNESAT